MISTEAGGADTTERQLAQAHVQHGIVVDHCAALNIRSDKLSHALVFAEDVECERASSGCLVSLVGPGGNQKVGLTAS